LRRSAQCAPLSGGAYIDLFHRTVDEAARQAEKYGIEIHYSIKANSQKRLLSYMREKGIGADCVSGNEVAYALDCGFTPETHRIRRSRKD